MTLSFGLAVAAQAIAFVLLDTAFHLGAAALLDAAAGSNGGSPPEYLPITLALVRLVLDIFFALAIGFIGARRLLMAIVRATPHPMKPPTRPVPLAALCAAVIIAAVSIIELANSVGPLSVPYYGWIFLLLRDGVIAFIFWYAARRAVVPTRSR